MRRLILMRHAKSDWDSGVLDDHARPLSGRGRRDAPRVAQHLHTLGWVPEQVLCSDSTRTLQTWALLAPVLAPGRPAVLHTLPQLYHAGPEALRAALGRVDDGVHTVLALGHNPGWEDALAWLCGQHHALTTANAALLVAPPGRWAEVVQRAGAWRCERVLRPKELG